MGDTCPPCLDSRVDVADIPLLPVGRMLVDGAGAESHSGDRHFDCPVRDRTGRRDKAFGIKCRIAKRLHPDATIPKYRLVRHSYTAMARVYIQPVPGAVHGWSGSSRVRTASSSDSSCIISAGPGDGRRATGWEIRSEWAG